MLDGDGNTVFIGSRNAYSTHVDGHEMYKLASGARSRAPLTESKLVVLRDINAHRGTSLKDISMRVDADTSNRVGELLALRYITSDHRWLGYARFDMTQSGIEALKRKPIPIGAPPQAAYEPYVQPCTGYVRAGGEDAAAIKSKGNE